MPTLGDRRASGHSIMGVAIVDGAVLHTEAIGRCFSHGRWLEWLATPSCPLGRHPLLRRRVDALRPASRWVACPRVIYPSFRATVQLPLVVLLTATVGCTSSPSPVAADVPPSTLEAESVTFDGPPKALDQVECAELITDEEVAAILDAEEVTATEMTHSSCYWFADDVFIQLVVNTGDGYPDWRHLLLEEYTEEFQVTDALELRGDPANSSFAAFGPDRGLLLHGLGSRDQALRLLLLAISRL